jgi:hypothetical protein
MGTREEENFAAIREGGFDGMAMDVGRGSFR